MAISPPKCRTCGKTEWGHVCGGVIPVAKIILPSAKDVAIGAMVKVIGPAVISVAGGEKIKIPRKEYLKLKARERRARQRAAKIV